MPSGHLDVLEEMVFVLVARVGAFEAELPGFYLEDIADDVGERGLVDARAFIDAIAGVEADLLGRMPLIAAFVASI